MAAELATPTFQELPPESFLNTDWPVIAVVEMVKPLDAVPQLIAGGARQSRAVGLLSAPDVSLVPASPSIREDVVASGTSAAGTGAATCTAGTGAGALCHGSRLFILVTTGTGTPPFWALLRRRDTKRVSQVTPPTPGVHWHVPDVPKLVARAVPELRQAAHVVGPTCTWLAAQPVGSARPATKAYPARVHVCTMLNCAGADVAPVPIHRLQVLAAVWM